MMGFPIVYEDNSFSDNAEFWESYRWPEVRIIKDFMSIWFYSVLKSNEADQKEFNGDIKEDITTNTTETGVMSVHQNVFVDVYHAGYCMLWR